ncbi:hypothetical protein OF829_03100 [Sphingomonas sp. LB-2]|uniref:hypothetical protein n=1 Tax=Sphingomonas caeni TaxID=2984949 RepID=UPI00222EE115|nr:hypothetical protein [Sphingomonas caeni]MCW3846211.1 hypothetical protein [Sphingomonas caeni]
MTPALAWRLCALAGLATLVISTGFGWIAGLTACGPSGGVGPILAFELARTPEQLAALFGHEPCTSTLAAAQRTGLWLDMLGFIPAYSAFLALAGAALRPAWRHLGTLAIAAVLLAGLCDWLEGVVMFSLLGDLPGQPWQFGLLFWTVRPKFALLGLGEILLAVLLLRHGWLGRIAALVLGVCGAIALFLILIDPHDPLMMKAHSWGWTALLILAMIAAIRPSLAAARQSA